ncbi:MAG: ergothioneine biosynthesis protein EgtB [Bacteroidota bacterium]
MSLLTTEQTSSSLKQLGDRFTRVRQQSMKICETLKEEDFVVQPVVDVSPPKWHLAHTTWFFETFILKAFDDEYKVFDQQYDFLFNSYYESVGKRTIRAERGFMTRPTVSEIKNYRSYVDQALIAFLGRLEDITTDLHDLIVLGIQHEQQHQELMMYDIKRIFGGNPIFPIYREIGQVREPAATVDKEWLSMDEGIYEIGIDEGDPGFSFDNESGKHKVYLQSYEIESGLVSNGEFLEFVKAGGYKSFKYWLMEGWEWIKQQEFKNPAYWFFLDGEWVWFDLQGGLRPLEMDAPVTHVSFYEADAYARWRGLRLPSEFEWEAAARKYSPEVPLSANFVEEAHYHPVVRQSGNYQFFGDVWEWTNSAYLPYPHFETKEGAVGEYNGKFMVNQMVLRGGSCATPRDHIRHTYRNFFHPHLKWFFNGLRLARYS